MSYPKRNIVERMERHLPRMAANECWETSYKSSNDTGHRLVNNEHNIGHSFCHRVAWEMHHAQPIPEGMSVLHTCDNPRCCNPEHLYIGDHTDNMRDRTDRGRTNLSRNELGQFIRAN